jgi:hypothetical protein
MSPEKGEQRLIELLSAASYQHKYLQRPRRNAFCSFVGYQQTSLNHIARVSLISTNRAKVRIAQSLRRRLVRPLPDESADEFEKRVGQ